MSGTVYLILFVAGLVSGVINTVAGGGSILTLPALILIAGMPAVAANATNRIGIVMQNCVAIGRFRQGKVTEHGLTWRVTLIGLCGVVLGAKLAAHIPDDQFEKILGILMLALLPLILLKPKPRLSKGEGVENAWSPLSFRSKWAVLAAFFFLGVYAGFLQAGVGIMILIALGYLVRMDLVRGNYVKLVFILVQNLIALLTFMQSSVEIYWIAGLFLTAGQMCGAWVGSWVAIKKGEKWILVILTLAIVLSSAKLLGWLDPFLG